MDQVRNHKILQANLNHCAGAQDLFLQTMAEWSIGVAVAAEPYFVSPRPNWVGDVDSSVAIIGSADPNCTPPTLKERGSGYVAAKWGEVIIFGVYFSPNRTLPEFEDFLDRLGASVLRMAPSQVLIMGDFNAKSTAWGSSRPDIRGRVVEEWAAVTGLVLLNRGSVNTCVRWNGGSIVDLTFATPALSARVLDWRVVQDTETLSDHRYIRLDVSVSSYNDAAARHSNAQKFPRWAQKQLDRELLEERPTSTSGPIVSGAP
nr:uncharacterized protein LOC126056574 [Helicoverpa armigera]